MREKIGRHLDMNGESDQQENHENDPTNLPRHLKLHQVAFVSRPHELGRRELS